MNIVFVRHCEIEVGNEFKSDFPLSAYGQRQAIELADELFAGIQQVDHIWTSPCIRAVETAAYLVRKFRCTVSILDMVADIGYQDRNWDTVRDLSLTALKGIIDYHRNVEPIQHAGIIVTHGFPIQVMLGYLMYRPENDPANHCARGRYIIYHDLN